MRFVFFMNAVAMRRVLSLCRTEKERIYSGVGKENYFFKSGNKTREGISILEMYLDTAQLEIMLRLPNEIAG
jgi:hypothetical protein